MIEPQNPMVPLAPEPRAADGPSGESVGFGEMLAQSLGLVAQVDPNAVQQIVTGGHGQHAAPEGDQDAPTADSDTATEPAGLVKAALPMTPIAPVTVVRSPVPGVEPVPVDGGEEPVPGTRFPGLVDGRRPIRTLPTPPTLVAALEQAEPVDGIWTPSLTAPPTDSVAGSKPDTATDVPITAQAPSHPVLGPEQQPTEQPVVASPVTTPGVDPRPQPPVEITPQLPSTSPGATPDRKSLDPGAAPTVPPAEVRLDPAPRPGTGRRIPAPPALDTVPIQDAPTAVPAGSEQTVWPQAVRPPLVNLSPDAAVRVDAAPQPLAPPVEEVAARPLIAPTAEVAMPADGPVVTAPAGEAPMVAGPAPVAGNTPNPVQASALAERVMQAVDLQRTQPPPRSMVVDIPEVEGLRLVVSVRSGGQVSVTPAGGSTADAFTPFANDVSRVLADRGFVMTGDGRRRDHNPFADQDDAPSANRRPGFGRPSRVDNDLRI